MERFHRSFFPFQENSANQAQRINYRVGKAGESCNIVCENHGEQCMTTEHWMWQNNGTKWFTDANYTCEHTTPVSTRAEIPFINIDNNHCFGYEGVPNVIQCSASKPSYARVCPCKRNGNAFFCLNWIPSFPFIMAHILENSIVENLVKKKSFHCILSYSRLWPLTRASRFWGKPTCYRKIECRV